MSAAGAGYRGLPAWADRGSRLSIVIMGARLPHKLFCRPGATKRPSEGLNSLQRRKMARRAQDRRIVTVTRPEDRRACVWIATDGYGQGDSPKEY